MVVDPPYAIEQLLVGAERQGVRIVRVIETHTHADHLSGHGRLALEHGLPVSIHPAAGVDYPHDPIHDGDELEVGAITLRVVHTPGHRPEHCCLVVTDRSRGDEPWLVLTGDSLFVGDAARPDLAVEARGGRGGLYHSLQRLMELPDRVEVFPGHVAGSLCGKAMSSKPSTTIGFERLFNPSLQFAELDTFVADARRSARQSRRTSPASSSYNRGPFLGRPPQWRSSPSLPPIPSYSTSGRSPPISRGIGPGRSTCRCPGRASRRRPASCWMPLGP